MKALLISYFFPPSKSVGSLRSFSLSKHLPKNDIDVVLLTSETELKDNKELQKEYGLKEIYFCKKTKLREWGYKTKILAVLELLKLDKLLFFPDVYFPWIKKAVKAGKKAIEESNPDFILASAPPFSVFKAAVKLSKKFKLPLILDYRDPWNGNPFIKYPANLVRKRYLRAEQKIAEKSDFIVTVGDECAKLISQTTNYPLNKIKIIHNGFIKENVPKQLSKKKNSTFTITIAGSLYVLHDRKFQTFLTEFAKFIEKNKLSPKQIRIQYAGGSSRKIINREVENAKMQNYFHDLGYLDYEEYYSVLNESHILLYFIFRETEYAIATRLFDFFNSNSHVLFIGKEGGMSRICREIEQNFSIVKEDARKVSRILEELYQASKSESLKYGCNNDLLQKFDRENLANEYALLLKDWFNKKK